MKPEAYSPNRCLALRFERGQDRAVSLRVRNMSCFAIDLHVQLNRVAAKLHKNLLGADQSR